MSKTGCLAGFAAGTVLRTAIHIIGIGIRFISAVLLFFGLYLPFFYLIYGLLLYLLTEFRPFDLSADSQLYILGLVLTVIGSVIISVRHLILEPLTSLVEYADRKNKPEQPLIYRSNVMPDLIIYEYTNRYDVYRDINGRLSYLRTEGKGRR